MDIRSYPLDLQDRLARGVGIDRERLLGYSLKEFVRPGNPPVLIQHGTDDEIEPIDNVRRFAERMLQAGNDCTLLEYEHAKHAFHYPGGGRFDDVMAATASFLGERIAVA